MPGISVIVPVYQGEKHIQKCVESVQEQTFQDWELLLVDDGSRDKSRQLCEACAAKDSRIRALHKKNGGVSSARNYGLSEAKGEYIAFLDADDRLEPRCLETLWNARLQAGADSAACAHWNVRPDGTKWAEQVLPAGVYDAQEIREKLVAPLVGDRLAQPLFNGFIWRYLYSAELIRKNRLCFEGAYLEDELFLMEYFCHAQKLVAVEEPLYRYFLNPASVTHRYMADFLKTFSRFMERKEEVIKKYGLESLRPQWRENSNWAGLLIAVGNEYAPGNKKSIRQRQKTVQEICKMPVFAEAIQKLTPVGMSKNKQMVASFVKGGHFFILTQLYRLKNRI